MEGHAGDCEAGARGSYTRLICPKVGPWMGRLFFVWRNESTWTIPAACGILRIISKYNGERVSGTRTRLNREAGANPARSRHCKRGAAPRATVSLRGGKAEQRAGSRKSGDLPVLSTPWNLRAIGRCKTACCGQEDSVLEASLTYPCASYTSAISVGISGGGCFFCCVRA